MPSCRRPCGGGCCNWRFGFTTPLHQRRWSRQLIGDVFSGVATSGRSSSSSTRLGTIHHALEALGPGASSCSGQTQDLLIVVHQRVEQFLCVASDGVANKTMESEIRDGVANKTKPIEQALNACSPAPRNREIRALGFRNR